jgi:hypothetical protein
MQPLDDSEQVRRFRRLIPNRRTARADGMTTGPVGRYLPGLSKAERREQPSHELGDPIGRQDTTEERTDTCASANFSN